MTTRATVMFNGSVIEGSSGLFDGERANYQKRLEAKSQKRSSIVKQSPYRTIRVFNLGTPKYLRIAIYIPRWLAKNPGLPFSEGDRLTAELRGDVLLLRKIKT